MFILAYLLNVWSLPGQVDIKYDDVFDENRAGRVLQNSHGVTEGRRKNVSAKMIYKK